MVFKDLLFGCCFLKAQFDDPISDQAPCFKGVGAWGVGPCWALGFGVVGFVRFRCCGGCALLPYEWH